MATTLNFKPLIDKPEWRPVSVPQAGLTPYASGIVPIVTQGGVAVSDFRCNNYNNPKIYYPGIQNAFYFMEYNAVNDGWAGVYNNAWTSGGSAGSGSTGAFAPSQGPKGLILAGSTASALNLDTTYYAPLTATWTRSGSIVTVTTSRPHGFYTNQRVSVSASSDTAAIPLTQASAPQTVTSAPSTTTFTMSVSAAGGLSGTITVGIPIITDQWADRGDGLGFMIRVIGLTSGKTEERRIISNTGYSGIGNNNVFLVAPTVYLDQPLSFTPSANDRFELLSGKIYYANSGAAIAGQWRSFDIATLQNADNWYGLNGNLSVTSLSIGSTGQGGTIVFDEQHVPANRIPGEGFVVGASTYDTASLTGTNYINVKNCLLATATGANTITGQAANGDAGVVANEYRNFQIRIVEDTVNTTANGQRRRISSHTAGPSAVYTLSANWTVTPSANCKFVIENWTDNILLTSPGSASMFTYKASNLCEDTSQTIDTWSTSQFTSSGGPTQSGVIIHCFGAKREVAANTTVRNSYIYVVSSGNIYTFDIAGGTNGAWVSSVMFRGTSLYIPVPTSSTNVSYAYDPFTGDGDAIYIFTNNIAQAGNNHQIFKLSLLKGQLTPYVPIKTPYGYISGTTFTTSNPNGQNKMGTICYQDGTTKLTAIYAPAFGRTTTANLNEYFELFITV